MAEALLSLVFLWAAAAKTLRPGLWVRSLRAYRLGAAERGVAVVVPALEAATAILCIAAPPRWGALASLLLVGCFSAAILRSGRKRLPCACFGGGREKGRSRMLARNAGIAAVALTALAWPRLEAPSSIAPDEVVPALLVLAGISAAGLTVVLTRSALRR